jgi:hypothetical protein
MSPAPALNGEEEVERVARAEERVAEWLFDKFFSDMADLPEGWLERKAAELVALPEVRALAARRPATEAEQAIERVRALADKAANTGTLHVWSGAEIAARIRAALAPTPTLGE